MNNFKHFIKRNRFLSYGLPFVLLLVGGSFGLEKFAQLRYVFRKTLFLTPEKAKELGIEMRSGADKPTLDTEYEKLKQMNIENWENVRGPRPWEENFGAAQQRSG